MTLRLLKVHKINPTYIHNLIRGLSYYFHKSYSEPEVTQVLNNFTVIDDFLSESEENSLITEIEPVMRRRRYEFNHWDDAIHGYKESERLKWTPENELVINRIKSTAFPAGVCCLDHTHILDLADTGFIKPHIDSVRHCGPYIAGVSLLSDSIMRFVHKDNKELVVDFLLKRRSLYVMKGAIRYDFTHEILPSESTFDQVKVPKTRRVSVICRTEPSESDQST